MKHQLNDINIHIATGGRKFDPAGEVVIMLHGSGQNHLTWVLQSRYFAYRGFAVLAPDFPATVCLGAARWSRLKLWRHGSSN